MVGPEDRERMEYKLAHPAATYWDWIEKIAEVVDSEEQVKQVRDYGRLFLRDRQTGNLRDDAIPNAFMEIAHSCGSHIAVKIQIADHLWGQNIKQTLTPFIPPEDVPQTDKQLG